MAAPSINTHDESSEGYWNSYGRVSRYHSLWGSGTDFTKTRKKTNCHHFRTSASSIMRINLSDLLWLKLATAIIAKTTLRTFNAGKEAEALRRSESAAYKRRTWINGEHCSLHKKPRQAYNVVMFVSKEPALVSPQYRICYSRALYSHHLGMPGV